MNDEGQTDGSNARNGSRTGLKLVVFGLQLTVIGVALDAFTALVVGGVIVSILGFNPRW